MSPPADVSCAERIALLHLLHKAPVPPSRNDPSVSPIRHESYTMPFDRERQFVGACAFLSCVRADLKRIPAVCVQEVPETESLNLFVAVNKREAHEAREYLREMKTGFMSVFQELVRVGKANGTEVQARLFNAVVSMCSERIHQRLGIVKTNGRTRTPIRDILAEVIKNLRRRRPTWTDFINKAKDILDLLDAWLKHRVLFRLRNIMDAIHDFFHSVAWKTFVASMPPLDIEPGQVDRLVRAVDKLSRYKEVATYLYRTAKRYPIARLVRVIVVDLPPTMFSKAVLEDHVTGLMQVFERVRTDKQALSHVCDLLGMRLWEAQSSFEESVRLSRDRPAIHAEVQLLAYCDLNLHGMKPRVICSSKEACFLCDLLIKTHGKVYTPYTHGRLYPGWRLPMVRGDQLANELNLALQRCLQESLTRMRRENRRIRRPLPENESASHTLMVSSTTSVETESGSEGGDEEPVGSQCSAAVAAGSTVPQKPEPAKDNHGTSDAEEPLSLLVDPTPSVHKGALPPAGISTDISVTEMIPVSEPDVKQDIAEEGNANATSNGGRRQSYALCRGEGVSTRLTVDNPQMFIADRFDLLIDRCTPCSSPTDAKCAPKKITYDTSWITADEASSVLEQSGFLIIDINTLDEVSFPWNRFTTFFLRDGDGCVLRVSLDADMSS